MQKRVAIYDPYLDTLGGGERYCLTVAEIFLKKGFHVDLFWSGDKNLIEKAQARFSLNLSDIKIVPDIFNIKPKKLEFLEECQFFSKFVNHTLDPQKITLKIKKFFSKVKTTNNYDVVFFVSDGSVPFLFGKKNFLHIQVPFVRSADLLKNALEKPKLKLITNIICNSQFTSKFQTGIFKNKSLVLYPPVDVDKFKISNNKENIILSVGRFDNVLNAKKQDILIDAFKILLDQGGAHNWKLVLAGGSLSNPDQNSYLKLLYQKAKGLPVNFVVNPQFSDLQKIYSESKIYWHAAGFDIDENVHPENTEHFGITVVEAMASGLVPVVINKGGIPEIVENGVNGFLWNDIDELVSKTKKLIDDPESLKLMSQQSIINCRSFSKENFEKRLLSIVED